MKRTILFAAAAALLAVSCNKEAASSIPDAPSAEGKAKVTVRLTTGSDRRTRAAGDPVADTPAERKVNTLDVFFINHATKALDAHAGTFVQEAQAEDAASGDTQGTTTVTADRVSNAAMDIWVVANAPVSLKEQVTGEASLKAALSAFAQNGPQNFVMVASKMNVDLPHATSEKADGLQLVTSGGAPVRVVDGIVLERVVNKVVIGSIAKDFESAALQALTVTLKGAYLLNVPKEVKYFREEGLDAVPAASDDSYWNPTSPFEANALITHEADAVIAAATPSSAGTELGYAFYFYPNPAAEAESASQEDYVTKLVLKVQIGDDLYWYPIGITQQAGNARNLFYSVDAVTLRATGNPVGEDPNKYIDKTAVEVSMTVKDWVSADVAGSYNGWMN